MTALKGRTAIITGASHGLGFEIARQYVIAGADVILCAREEAPLLAASDKLQGLRSDSQAILAQATDVSKVKDVERLLSVALDRLGRVHILVNNAGVYGPMGPLEEVDWEEWKQAIEVNLYGSALMCRALLPHFKRLGDGKIIQISGGGATNPLPRISAYAASKAAIVRLVETLAEEVRDYNIDVNAIAPGPLNTRLLDEVLEAGPERVGRPFYERSLKQLQEGGAPLYKAAELCVFLGSSASDGITGKLLSALWDPWKDLPNRIGELRESDIYTLRRIVPKDRGATWGD